MGHNIEKSFLKLNSRQVGLRRVKADNLHRFGIMKDRRREGRGGEGRGCQSARIIDAINKRASRLELEKNSLLIRVS